MRQIFLITAFLLAAPAMAQTQPAAQPPGFTTPPAAAQPAAPAAAPAETTTIDAQKAGKPGRDVFIGAYITVDRTCKVGPTPKVEFPEQPKNGKARTRPDAINLRTAPGIPRNKCLGVSPSGIAVMYRSNNKFKGDDAFTYRVIFPDGHIREVKATVTVQ